MKYDILNESMSNVRTTVVTENKQTSAPAVTMQVNKAKQKKNTDVSSDDLAFIGI
jgi:hypothetical protein